MIVCELLGAVYGYFNDLKANFFAFAEGSGECRYFMAGYCAVPSRVSANSTHHEQPAGMASSLKLYSG